MDFAFFAVNFGYSKSDYEALTKRERAFIYKAWENKIVMENSLIYSAVFTATYNVNRPKQKRPLKLWKKNVIKKADIEIIDENLNVIKSVDRAEGKGWINKIYKTIGLKLPERRDKSG